MEDQMSKMAFSIVIPAYNEELRLPATLRQLELLQDHELRFWDRLQVVIVCDGCKDQTEKVARSWLPDKIDKKVISYKVNRGKGGALQEGMSHTYGEIAGFIDADGSTNPRELPMLAQNILLNKSDIVIGSRRTADAFLPHKQPWWRSCLGSVFAEVATTILQIPIKDSQCGCKLFDGKVARYLYSNSTNSGFATDLEILHTAFNSAYRVHEQGITWRHMEGSTVSPLKDGLKMLLAVIKMRFTTLTVLPPLKLYNEKL